MKVLNLTFRVTFPSESEMAASGAVGWCDPESQTIAVSNDQPMDSAQFYVHGLYSLDFLLFHSLNLKKRLKLSEHC